MLKDPNFNVVDLTLRNMHHGISFSEYYFTNPIDGREIPTVVGVTIPTHPKWADLNRTTPITIMCSAKHSTGIYFGFPLDNTIEMFSSTEILSDFADFDLSTGMWYSFDEMREQYSRVWSDKSPLTSGKPCPNYGSIANSYGIADNITQILKRYRKVVTNPDYDVALHLTHIGDSKKNGMRWHKQGSYIGNFKHKCDYMSDEVGLGDLIQFHFYVIKN